MSTHKVPVVAIDEIKAHPNADKLELAVIAGWECVVQKGRFKKGDMAVYFPVDSILTQELDDQLFPVGGKFKLHHHRIKSIKIRGQMSQGLLVTPEELKLTNYFEGQDLMETLGITKYETKAAELPKGMFVKKAVRHRNKNFKEYTDIQNFKWYNRLFQKGEIVYVSEKMHGTSFRAGWVRSEANTLWRKLLNVFGLLPRYQFCWGSRRVQIQGKLFHKGYYQEDVYTKMVKQYDLKNKIPPGCVVYGEIVGDGIQKGYTYGCGSGEHKLFIYDIMKDDQYLPYFMKEEVVDEHTTSYFPGFKSSMLFMELEPVPMLYVGPWDEALVESLRDGDSRIGDQKIREGCVLKSSSEEPCSFGRKVLKLINPEYYLKNQDDGTDFH